MRRHYGMGLGLLGGVAAVLCGCVSRTPGPPIVLHPPGQARQAARRLPIPTAPPRPAAPLSASEKERLFQAFEDAQRQRAAP